MEDKINVFLIVIGLFFITGCTQIPSSNFTDDAINMCNTLLETRSGLGIKGVCIGSVSIVNDDIAICDKATDGNNKNGCYTAFAFFKKDLSVCDSISEEVFKDGCYSKVALAKKDPESCRGLRENIQPFCYEDIAIATKDSSICELVHPEGNKMDCKDKVSKS